MDDFSASPAKVAAPDLSVLVVSYNTRTITIDCLASLRDHAAGVDYELIVVDNASSDGSAAAISAAHPKACLIQLDENIGFGRANNLAARKARGRYLLLLNPDTVVRENAIQALLSFAKELPKARIWGGRTLFADGRLNPTSCWRAASLWTMICQALGLSRVFQNSALFNPETYGGWRRDTVREVDIVTGCFLLIERAFWEELRGFDPEYFIYGEEADLCLRARRLGARPAMTPAAEIVHLGGASEPARSSKLIRLFKGKVTLMRKHWSESAQMAGMALFRLTVLIRVICYGLGARLTGREGLVRQAADWGDVWLARSEWLRGYPKWHGPR